MENKNYTDVYINITPEEKEKLDKALALINENRAEKVGYEFLLMQGVNNYYEKYIKPNEK